MLVLVFRFTPADGTALRDITVTIATQDDKHLPLMISSDWGPASVQTT